MQLLLWSLFFSRLWVGRAFVVLLRTDFWFTSKKEGKKKKVAFYTFLCQS